MVGTHSEAAFASVHFTRYYCPSNLLLTCTSKENIVRPKNKLGQGSWSCQRRTLEVYVETSYAPRFFAVFVSRARPGADRGGSDPGQCYRCFARHRARRRRGTREYPYRHPSPVHLQRRRPLCLSLAGSRGLSHYHHHPWHAEMGRHSHSGGGPARG